MSHLGDPPETLLRLAAAGAAQRRWVLFIGPHWRERQPLAEARLSPPEWRVSYLADIGAALPLCRQIAFDAVVLDQAQLVPRATPLWLHLRASLRCPLLVTSEQAGEADEVAVLEQGADDFIAWPIAPRRLRARLTAACRGRGPAAEEGVAARGSTRLRATGWWLDAASCTLRRGFERVDLTPVQLALLGALMGQPGRVHGCAELVHHARQCGANPCPSEIRVHIHRLRQRLRNAGVHDLMIANARGLGFAVRETAWPPAVTRTCTAG